MSGGFLNYHPFFVHLPLVLIPVAAVTTWLGRKIKKEGFDVATAMASVAAAVGGLLALASGWVAERTVASEGALAQLMEKHEMNGIVVTAIACVVAMLTVAQRRGWLGARTWWPRAVLLTFAAIGVVFSGQMGAEMVYLHGAGVVPMVQKLPPGR